MHLALQFTTLNMINVISYLELLMCQVRPTNGLAVSRGMTLTWRKQATPLQKPMEHQNWQIFFMQKSLPEGSSKQKLWHSAFIQV